MSGRALQAAAVDETRIPRLRCLLVERDMPGRMSRSPLDYLQGIQVVQGPAAHLERN